MNMISAVKKFWSEEEGASAVEYAVVTGIIAIGAITAATTFGASITTWFTDSATSVGTIPTS